MMNRAFKLLPFLLILPFMTSGCVEHQYAWGNYSSSLYGHYNAPEKKEDFIAELHTIILEAEQLKKVPPGLYAEYGYALLESNQLDNAITYFKKEQDAWPESQLFMTKMIRNVENLKNRHNTQEEPTDPALSTPDAASETGTPETASETGSI
ncbi:MAG: DUF4810 domain-containing protein [Magnetococcales bacterium]|nr:DUF4810 domain-containing protein [Magnetococcales bacterium]